MDIVIVGAGLSGTAAAVTLGRQGHRVALLGMHAEPIADFRAETFGDGQCEQLRRLGLFEGLAAAGTAVREVVCARRGRVIERIGAEELNLSYPAMIAAVRAQLPPTVRFIAERVARLETGPQQQRVHLAGGDVLDARLIVLATGPGDGLRRMLGIERRMLCENHTSTFGFDLAPAPGERIDFPTLVYYGERIQDRIDYLRLFPMNGLIRANLFAHWAPGGEDSRALRADPRAAIYARLPGLRRLLGDFRVLGKVEMRVTDLYRVDGHRRDGVVLIGDAFRMSCPAAGTGVACLLTDVEQLCLEHIPRWFASPGMEAAKIATFYDDPLKLSRDDHASHTAEYRRKLSTETGLRWAVHRLRVEWQRRLRAALRPPLNPVH